MPAVAQPVEWGPVYWPEPSDEPCGEYIGWSQPTQGTFQIDRRFEQLGKPDVGDRLDIVRGYQAVHRGTIDAPTVLQAQIPLVSRRTTYLVGGSPMPTAAEDNLSARAMIRFEGWGRGIVDYRQTTLRTRLRDAAGNVIHEFNPAETTTGSIPPVLFPVFVHNCSGFEVNVPFQADYGVYDQSLATNAYTFPTGGNYTYETEVMEYRPLEPHGWGDPLGYKTEVKFRVVDTRIPRMVVYPTWDTDHDYGMTRTAIEAVLERNSRVVTEQSQKELVTHMPVAEGDPQRKIWTSTVTRKLPGLFAFSTLQQEMVTLAGMGNYDLAMYYVDEKGYEDLIGTDSGGVAAMKNLAFIKGEASKFLDDDERDKDARVFMHELAHTTLVDLWSAEEMRDICGLDYHNKDVGPFWGIAVHDEETGQPKDLDTFDFIKVGDYMALKEDRPITTIIDFHSNQCTWRHLTDAWSRPLIDPDLIVVAGTVRTLVLPPTPRGELGRIYHKVGDIKGPTAPGRYRIDLLNAFGTVLESHPFAVNFAHSEALFTSGKGVFKFELEAPPGLYEVRLYEEQQLLDTRRFTANPPVVGHTLTMTRLAADYTAGWVDMRLDWTSSDADFFSNLVHTVQYSEDGEVYFETGVFEIDGTSATIRMSTSATELRIWANDGARSDDAVFEVSPFCWFNPSCTLTRR